jgi:hypothetical protein
MARIETDPNYNAPTFSRATAPTDIFKKEDVQNVAAAFSTHTHDGSGKGLAVAFTGVPPGSIPGTALADGAVTSVKIADGTIATVDIANAAVTNAKLASDTARANLLTNGGFEIWQRGVGPFGGSLYSADRWFAVAGTGGTSFASSITRDSANADLQSNYCWTCTHTFGTTASVLSQSLEVGNSLKGKTVTFSVRIKANTSISNAAVLQLIDVDGSTVLASSAAASLTTSYQTFSVTGTPAASNASGKLGVWINLQATTTYYIDNAMLVVGSQYADYAPLHPADDLARCLRYYEVAQPAALGYAAMGFAYATTNIVAPLAYKTVKAVAPTVTLSAAAAWQTAATNGAGLAATVVAPGQVSSTTCNIAMTVASGLALGQAAPFASAAAGTATISVEANP